VTALWVALYALPIPLPWPYGIVTPNGICSIDGWKNQPDLWTDTLVTLACLGALSGRYWAALVCAALAVCYKESGWLAFPLMLATVTVAGRLRTVRASHVAVAIGLIAGLVALRASAGHAVFAGYRQGTNANWLSRYIAATGGIYVNTLFTPREAWCYGNTIFLIAVLARRLRPILSLLAGFGLLAAAVLLSIWTTGIPLDVTAYSLFDPGIPVLPAAIEIAIWIAAVSATFRVPNLRRWALFSVFGSCLCATLFVAAAQVLRHALHLAYAFQSLFVAVLVAAVVERIRQRVSRSQRTDTGSASRARQTANQAALQTQ
jgi:hypothetical protein